jgi:hypothetical protein
LLTVLHGNLRLEAAEVVGIIGNEAQANPRPTADVPQELQLGAPVSTQLPGGHTAGIVASNTLEDFQVVIATTVNTNTTNWYWLLVTTAQNKCTM